jgi:hypothetical protein
MYHSVEAVSQHGGMRQRNSTANRGLAVRKSV